MKRYSVSLVYTSMPLNGIVTTLLRVLVTYATSREEALGKAIINFKGEAKREKVFFNMEVIIEITDDRGKEPVHNDGAGTPAENTGEPSAQATGGSEHR